MSETEGKKAKLQQSYNILYEQLKGVKKKKERSIWNSHNHSLCVVHESSIDAKVTLYVSKFFVDFPRF